MKKENSFILKNVRKWIKENPVFVTILLTFAVLMGLYFILKPILLGNSGISAFAARFFQFYQDSLIAVSSVIFKLGSVPVRYWPEFDYLVWAGNYSSLGIPFLAIRQTFIYILIILVFHADVKQTLTRLIAGLSLIFLLNLLRIVSIVLIPLEPELIKSFYRSLLSLGIFLYLIKLVKGHVILAPYFNKLNNYLREKVILNIGTFIMLFLSRGFLIQLYKLIFPKELLAGLVLKETEWIIRLFGADPRVEGRFIYIRRTWVFLGDACLGIMLIFTYIALILMLRAKLINKLTAIFGGVLIITIINSARIAAISFHLQNHGGTYSPAMDPHEAFGYMVYAAVFIMWVVFILWGRGKKSGS